MLLESARMLALIPSLCVFPLNDAPFRDTRLDDALFLDPSVHGPSVLRKWRCVCIFDGGLYDYDWDVI